MSTFDGYFHAQFGRRIRADRFTQQDPATVLQLLSHAHADHTVGLSSKNLRGFVYCSAATKDIILRLATASERVHAEINGVKSEDYYTFRNLQEPVYNAKGKQVVRDGKKVRVDVLKPLPLDIRHDFSEYYGSPVAITLIDANHCPGAVMFLIETPEHAVLYTGDVRSEPYLINNLRENPYLQNYIPVQGKPSRRTLDQIYLDTSAALNKGRLLPKLQGVNEALKLFDLFPSNTRFFINAWTWGYEELLRAIAHRYNCKIHLDEYKSKIYRQSTVSDFDQHNSSLPENFPSLAEIGTAIVQSSRFHACERRWKCPHVRVDGQGCFDTPEMLAIWEDTHERVLRQEAVLKSKGLLPHTVFVNPADATEAGWEKYKERISAQCEDAREGKADWPTNILVPLARHSSLPELQDLVALFRPNSIYPNTIYPELKGHDYTLLAQYFSDTLAPGGRERLAEEARRYLQQVSAQDKHAGKHPVRQLSPQEEEQSQEVREAVESKFALVSSRLPEDFLTNNFDHLDNPQDLDLLISIDEETQSQVQEHVASQELPEIPRHVNKKKAIVLPQLELEPQTEASPVRKAPVSGTPPVPSSSNDGTERVQQDALLPKEKAPVEQATSDWLAGQGVYIDTDAYPSEDLRQQVAICVQHAGGVIVQAGCNATSQETAVAISSVAICAKRSGLAYSAARKLAKPVGNPDWLVKCLHAQNLDDPDLDLLNQPYPEALQDMENFTVSSTGFEEGDKKAIKTMVTALGWRYLPELSKTQTSLLIANGNASRKCEYAARWNIPVVNALWLEECFAKGRVMPSDAARYTDPKVTTKTLKRRIGQKAASELVSVPQRAAPSPTTSIPTVKETAPSPAKLSARPLQPTTNKRKQQAAGANSQDTHTKSKKAKAMSASTKAEVQQKANQPETFESVSTAHQDDTEQIRHVKEIVQKGLGLPRIRSCEYFK